MRYMILVKANKDSEAGVKPSEETMLKEEVAFEKLESARQALLEATALAHPTVH